MKTFINEVVPSEFLEDLKDKVDEEDEEDDPFEDKTAQELLEHLEDKFCRLTPKEIKEHMAELNKPWDSSEGYEVYVKRLQTVQQTLKGTDEPVTDATMKRIAQGQFEYHPHMVDHVHEYTEWEDVEEENKSATWAYFRSHFEKKNRRHVNSQRTLAEAGIANNAQLHKDLDDMRASNSSWP